MDLAVHSRIFAIHIIQQIRMHEAMIERGIETLFLGVAAAVHLNAIQSGVPLRIRLLANTGEIPGRIFLSEIGSGVFETHVGNGGPDLDGIRHRVERQDCAAIFAGGIGRIAEGIAVPGLDTVKRPVKFRDKINSERALLCAANMVIVHAGHFVAVDRD